LVILKSLRRFSARLDWDYKNVRHAGRVLSKVDHKFRGSGWLKEDQDVIKAVVRYT